MNKSTSRLTRTCDSWAMACHGVAHAPSRVACEAMTRAGKRERHLTRMARCTFREEPGIDVRLLWEGADGWRLHEVVTNVSGSTCELRDYGGDWHFARVGPFTSMGGETWLGVNTNHDPALHSQWHDGGMTPRLLVSDHVVGSSDTVGHIVGYPPLFFS